jgi:hypothetical protein
MNESSLLIKNIIKYLGGRKVRIIPQYMNRHLAIENNYFEGVG